MAKRNVDDILKDSLPTQSKDIYVKKWREFLDFIGDKEKPDETDFMQYFDNLHNNRKFKASSIWSTYSMLNSMFQREFGEKLQNDGY